MIKARAVMRKSAVPSPPISELLKASMAAHQSSKGKVRSMDILKEAANLRRQAASLDPSFSDPAWAEEEKLTPRSHNTHAVLTAFYESKGL